MRKLIVTNIVSLDGFYEGPGGNVMALPMDGAFDAYCAERLGTADTLLLGRTSFALFSGFWPAMGENPDATPAEREISRRDDEVDKLVVSDTLSADETGGWRETTRIVRRASAHAVIAELKTAPGRDILVFGSRTLWHALLADGLVDELHLVVGGVVLGEGTRAFPEGLTRQLELLDTRRFAGSDNVGLVYAAS
jgi:dihydrofolate reductase